MTWISLMILVSINSQFTSGMLSGRKTHLEYTQVLDIVTDFATCVQIHTLLSLICLPKLKHLRTYTDPESQLKKYSSSKSFNVLYKKKKKKSQFKCVAFIRHNICPLMNAFWEKRHGKIKYTETVKQLQGRFNFANRSYSN